MFHHVPLWSFETLEMHVSFTSLHSFNVFTLISFRFRFRKQTIFKNSLLSGKQVIQHELRTFKTSSTLQKSTRFKAFGIVVGSVSVGTACSLYLTCNQNKITLLCEEIIDRKPIFDVDKPKEEKDCDILETVELTRNRPQKSLWIELFHFIKPDVIWFALSIPVSA